MISGLFVEWVTKEESNFQHWPIGGLSLNKQKDYWWSYLNREKSWPECDKEEISMDK